MREFCTDLAMTRGEPLAGTGALAERHLFMRWPKGKWRRPRFEAVDIGDDLRAAMNAAPGGGRYVGLFEGGDGAELELLSFPDAVRVVPRDQAHAVELVSAWAAGDLPDATPLPRRVILCCTDAKTDACCARYGFPVFKALSAHAGDFGFDVLQCTHIGGCHFAPSVIVMPERRRYGRLTPDTIPAFLAQIASHDIYLPAYRGNAALGELEQAAELAAQCWADERGLLEPFAIGSVEQNGEVSARVTVQSPTTTLSVALERTIFEVHGNCRNLDEPAKLVPRWVARTVGPALEAGTAR